MKQYWRAYWKGFKEGATAEWKKGPSYLDWLWGIFIGIVFLALAKVFG